MPMIIAIQPDDYTNPKTPEKCDASSQRWAELLQEAGHQVRWVNVYEDDIITQLRGCHGFMWRHAHFGGMYQVARRLLRVIEDQLGLVVYPDQNTGWHYDDKIAQRYLFEAAGIPIPKTWVWFDSANAKQWAHSAEYPLIMKLSGGAGAENVQLLHSPEEAEQWINRLFGPGVYSLEENALCLSSWKQRIKAAARAIIKGRPSFHTKQGNELHRNYILFQEFLPNNDFDTRIIVVGNRAWACRRFNRPNDYRASGSGLIDQTPENIAQDALQLAFDAASRLAVQCVAFDILRKNDRPLVGEISYTFPRYKPWSQFPGYWHSDLSWIGEPKLIESAQIEDFLSRLASVNEH